MLSYEGCYIMLKPTASPVQVQLHLNSPPTSILLRIFFVKVIDP